MTDVTVDITQKINDKIIKTACNYALNETLAQLYEHNVSQEYMPYWTGKTQETAQIITNKGKHTGRIQHITDYSKKIYYGGPRSRRYNSQAGPLWWERYLNGLHDDLPFMLFDNALEERLGSS